MTARRDMPKDFPDRAQEPLKDLAFHYGVSPATVLKWRRSLGISVPVGAPKSNHNASRLGEDKKRKVGADNADEIRTCLNCTAKRCTGHCVKVH